MFYMVFAQDDTVFYMVFAQDDTVFYMVLKECLLRIFFQDDTVFVHHATSAFTLAKTLCPRDVRHNSLCPETEHALF